MFKKGQAAMEFLMTYGWAILVVLAAIGALAYFGVLSPGSLLPSKCDFPAGIECLETPEASNGAGTITIAVANSYGHDITTSSFSLTNSSNYGCTTINVTDHDGDGVLQSNENGIAVIGGCTLPAVGSRYSTELSISFTSSDTGMQHTTVGKVAGKVAP